MKLLWILAGCCLAVSASPIFDESETRINGKTGWYIPRIDGTFYWVDKDVAKANVKSLQKVNQYSLLNPVTFYLYTKDNPSSGQKITADTKSINASKFNVSNPTRFIIHGWTQSHLSPINEDIRNAFLFTGDFNVIFVSWSRALSVDYLSSVAAVPGVGQQVASLIDFLDKAYGMSLRNLIVVGHSLGAHVAGFTGKQVSTGQIHTIFGLDPALPQYDYDEPEERLNSTDAYYVETIQTNGDGWGFLEPIGKASFYPNGGKTQPGCPLDAIGLCAHDRSNTYYAEAVSINKFAAVQCTQHMDAVNQNCGDSYSSVRMGAATNADMAEGYFYVPVNSESPFGVLN